MRRIRNDSDRVQPPARTPEGRERQLVSLAVDLAEKQLREELGIDIKNLRLINCYDIFNLSADKENVYYKSKLLSFKNNGKLKVFHEKDYNVYYLYDEESKNVYANDYLFETVNAPYKVVGVDGTHHFSLLFISKDGVYFY